MSRKNQQEATDKMPDATGVSLANFERSMKRLEGIVSEMESDELPLEDMLKRFEEGSALINECRQQLEMAKQKVELIIKKSASEVKLAPFLEKEEE